MKTITPAEWREVEAGYLRCKNLMAHWDMMNAIERYTWIQNNPEQYTALCTAWVIMDDLIGINRTSYGQESSRTDSEK